MSHLQGLCQGASHQRALPLICRLSVVGKWMRPLSNTSTCIMEASLRLDIL